MLPHSNFVLVEVEPGDNLVKRLPEIALDSRWLSKSKISFIKFRKCKGRVPFKKCHKKWKNSKRGRGGVSAGNQKVHNSKCGLFDKRGREAIFSFFPPNVNADLECLC